MDSDPCRDVLRPLTPSEAVDMLATSEIAERAAERLSEAIGARRMTIVPSIGRDGRPYVLVCGFCDPQVFVTIPAENVPEFIGRYIDPPLAG